MAQAKKKPAKRTASKSQDAIAMLKEDHANVKKMFKEFEKLKEDEAGEDEKSELVARICEELTMHAQLEEEIFYPAVRTAIEDDDLMDEAIVEHAEAKELIAQLEEGQPGDEQYDAKVTVLGENVEHHVKEEEEKMFPKVKKADLDLVALAEEMMQRKAELQGGVEGAEPEGRSASEGR